MNNLVAKLLFLTQSFKKHSRTFIAKDEDSIIVAMGQYLTENNLKFHSIEYIGKDTEANTDYFKKTCEVLNKPFSEVIHLPEMKIDQKLLNKITMSLKTEILMDGDIEEYLNQHHPTNRNTADIVQCWIASLQDDYETIRFAYICAKTDSDAKNRLNRFLAKNSNLSMIQLTKIAENVQEADIKLSYGALHNEDHCINLTDLLCQTNNVA